MPKATQYGSPGKVLQPEPRIIATLRQSRPGVVAREGEIVLVQFREQWQPLPRDRLPSLIQHFESQRDRFCTEAAAIHVQLHGLGHYRATP